MCSHDTERKITMTAAIDLMSDGRYSLDITTQSLKVLEGRPMVSSYWNLTLPEVMQILDATTAAEFCDPF
jgi:hypothetical protein